MPTKTKLTTISNALGAISTTKYLYTASKEEFKKFQAKKSFQITVQENDKLFDGLQKWVLTQLKDEDQKSLGASIYDKKLRIYYTGSKEHKIKLGAQWITFNLSESLDSDKSDEDLVQLNKKFRPRTLTFTATTLAGRQEILNLLEKIREETNLENDPPMLRTYRYGCWYSGKILPERPIESLVLKEGQIERIISDLRNFLDSKERYESIGAPWHRGYVFYGPPGTGKSSLAAVLARHFELDLNLCTLGDIKTDSELIRIISEASGILLIEDADVFESVVEAREKKTESASLSGLLNALDGVATPSGLITIITTNNIDRLDEALLRNGRIDLIEEISLLDLNQLQSLFFYVYKEDLGEIQFFKEIAPAQISEVFKKTDDAKQAREMIKEIFNER